jgi:hypothetical protein
MPCIRSNTSKQYLLLHFILDLNSALLLKTVGVFSALHCTLAVNIVPLLDALSDNIVCWDTDIQSGAEKRENLK